MAVEYLYDDTYDPPQTEESDDGQSRHTGHTVTFGVDGLVKEWGMWVPAANVPATLRWRLWDDDTNLLLAEVDVAALAPTPGQWARGTSADFDTPGDVEVLATGTYVITKYTLGGNWVYSSTTGSFDNAANITAVEGRYEGSGDGTSPPSGTFSFKPFVDVGFDGAAAGTEYTKSLAGSITPAGAIRRSTSRALAGTATPTGFLARTTSRALAGAVTPTGSIIRQAAKALAGTVTPVGAITSRALSRVFAGGISPTGRVLKLLSRLLGGSVTPAGSASTEPFVPGIPTTWRAGPPESKWSAGPPESKWSSGGRLPVEVFRAASTETVRSGRIAATADGAAVDPTGYTVTVAFPSTDIAPAADSSAWKTGSWDTDATTTPTTYRAQGVIGPDGVQELSPGTYYLFAKVTASGETPIIPSGAFKVVP